MEEINGLTDEVNEDDKCHREDIRHLPLVTIDGVDARDFDDAVYCEPQGSGWRLVVAIADVSHYVHPGLAMDDEALNRGNSVYFHNVSSLCCQKFYPMDYVHSIQK